MNSVEDETTTKSMIGKIYGLKHICKNIILSILKMKVIVKKNTHNFYDMTNFFAKIYSSFRASWLIAKNVYN